MVINDLPTELIVALLSDDTEPFVNPANRSRKLMAVCRLWHDIITSTPGFWTNVWIITRTPSPQYFQWLLQRLVAQLVRCKSALIDVHWQACMPESQTRQAMEIFGRYAPFDRWRSLHVPYHVGNPPDIASLSPPPATFRSLEILRTQSMDNWLVAYIQRTLSASVLLREFRGDTLSIRLADDGNPQGLWNILQKVSKVSAYSLLSNHGKLGGLPSNIINLTLVEWFSDVLDVSHLERIVIRQPIIAKVVDLTPFNFSALRTLDIAFGDGHPVGRLTLPVLVALHIRGLNHEILSHIDAPKLQVLITEREYTQMRGKSWAKVLKRRHHELNSGLGPEIGIFVDTGRMRRFLDSCQLLEEVGTHFLTDGYDGNVIRFLLFPRPPEDEVEEQGEGREHAVEFEMLPYNNMLSSSVTRHLRKLGTKRITFITVFLERIQAEEDLKLWGSYLRRFEGGVKGGGNREPDRSLGNFWTRREDRPLGASQGNDM